MIKDNYLPLIAKVAICITVCVILVGFIIKPTYVSASAEPLEPDYVSKIFVQDKVMQVEVTIDETIWDGLLANASDEVYAPADITINGETWQTVGIRAKGNSSLSMVISDETTDRYSFKVDFSEYHSGQTLYGLKKIVFNNMVGDTTYMKEYLSYDLFSQMGLPTPAFSFANITINGEPWGLYLAVETIEESFIERYYGEADGNLYKPENSLDKGLKMYMPDGENFNPSDMPNMENFNPSDMPNMENSNPSDMPARGGMKGGMPGNGGGSDLVYVDDEISSYPNIFDSPVFKSTTEEDFIKVINMMRQLSEGTDFESILNVDEVLRYFAVNTFLVNLDSYVGQMKHNYYLYEKDGVFEILPWDLNLSFGGFMLSSSTQAINFPIDVPTTNGTESSPLIMKLLEVPEYKTLYHSYLEAIVNNYVYSGYLENTILKLDQLIGPYIENDVTAFYTYDEYKASLPHLIQFGKDRSSSILSQLNGDQPSDTYGSLSTTVDMSALGTMGGFGGMNDRKYLSRPPCTRCYSSLRFFSEFLFTVGPTSLICRSSGSLTFCF